MSREESISKLEVYLGSLTLSILTRKVDLIVKALCLHSFSFKDQAIASGCDDELDISALDAFCHVIRQEPELCAVAAKLLTGRIQSPLVKESLLALDALEGNLSTFSNIHLLNLQLNQQNAWTRWATTFKLKSISSSF